MIPIVSMCVSVMVTMNNASNGIIDVLRRVKTVIARARLMMWVVSVVGIMMSRNGNRVNTVVCTMPL